jgi:hypothetical protein
MNNVPSKFEETLDVELLSKIKRAKRFTTFNYGLGYVVATIAVVSSICTTILVARPDFIPDNSKWVWLKILLAGLPAGALTINNVFRFEQKSNWCWKRALALEGVLRKWRESTLPDDDPAKAASAEVTAVEEQMRAEWVVFGTWDPGEGKK